MQLIDNWKQGWRFFTTWLISASAGLEMLYANLPGLQQYLPANVFHYGMAGLAILTLAARFIKQTPTAQGNP